MADAADGTDGADGIFGPRVDPDHPGSSSAFTTEGNVDTQYPQERLRTTQSAGEDARVLRPSRGRPIMIIPGMCRTNHSAMAVTVAIILPALLQLL